MRELQVVESGFVDRASFLSSLERLTAGLTCNEVQLQRIVLLEFWLRNRWPTPSAGTGVQAA